MVGYAGSPICIVDADMTLTQSKVKVRVTQQWLLAPFLGLYCFLSTSQEISWDKHLWNHLFYVEWDAEP